MSEPKTVATSFSEIVPGLFHYKIHDERVKSQCDAYALVKDGKVVLIDPLPLEDGLLARLGKVETIVIGTPSHQRCSWRYRREHQAKVYAPEGWSALEEKPDVTFKVGDSLPLRLRPHHAPGPSKAHHVFQIDATPGVLLCTDLWHVASGGVEFLPDKYMADLAQARESARRLLEVDFDILCLGHGDPILKGAKAVVVDLVRRDAAARRAGA